MNKIDIFIFGLFSGILLSGFYTHFMIKYLKKEGYLIFNEKKIQNNKSNKEKIKTKFKNTLQ